MLCSQEPGPATAVPGPRTPTLRASHCHLFTHIFPSPQTGKGTLRQRGSGGGRRVLEPTLSQSSRSRSTRILISSGMAREGWVSLSWMATCWEGGRQGVRRGSKPLPRQSPQQSARLGLSWR